MNYNYIVIEGNIGAGKTSFARRYAGDFNGKLILERFHDNPFLPKFYSDPEKYSFPLELSFLAERFQQLRKEVPAQELFSDFTVADYVFQKCLIFASINLPADEYTLYSSFFEVMEANIPKPDLIIYLHQDIEQLVNNIQQRGRDYEQKISPEYLRRVEKGYTNYFKQHPDQKTLFIDVNGMDFVKNESDYKKIILTIDGFLGQNKAASQ